MFYDGKKRRVAASQGYTVDIGPRPGAETGMEIIRHTVGAGDPGRSDKRTAGEKSETHEFSMSPAIFLI